MEPTEKDFFTSFFLETVDFRYRWTLSTGTASASGLRPGSSARAVPVGVATFHSNQRGLLHHKKEANSFKIEQIGSFLLIFFN